MEFFDRIVVPAVGNRITTMLRDMKIESTTMVMFMDLHIYDI